MVDVDGHDLKIADDFRRIDVTLAKRKRCRISYLNPAKNVLNDDDDEDVGGRIKQLVALKLDLRSFLQGIQIFCQDFAAKYVFQEVRNRTRFKIAKDFFF